MPENYEVKFSEETYSTKEQVMDAMNLANVDFIWNQVLAYRKKKTATFDLHTIDNTKLSLVFTNSITNRIITLERKLNKVFYEYNALSVGSKKVFSKKRLVKILGQVSSFSSSSTVSDSFIEALIDKSISTIPTDAIIVDDYYNAIKYIEMHDAGPTSFQEFNSIYYVLNSGEEPDDSVQQKQYRTNELDTPHYFSKGYVYTAALTERIDQMMDDLAAFINDGSQFASVRFITALFYSYYVMPYELFREHFSSLMFKLALSKAGFGVSASFINIETLMMNEDRKLKEASDNVQKTCDLTYFFDYVLGYLFSEIDDIFDDLALAQKEVVINENLQTDEDADSLSDQNESVPVEEPENLGIPSPVTSTTPSILSPNKAAVSQSFGSGIQIYGKQDVALPIFPTGLNGEDIEKIAVDLRETYPTLSKSQAHFYASHCTIGRSYTIQEFKSSESTSYETARTSMDYLATMGFFEKTKIRNKFVYKPIPRRR